MNTQNFIEQERIAYNSGNTELSTLLDYAANISNSHTNEIDDIDNALDLLGLSGKRGDVLYGAVENISMKLDAVDELIYRISLLQRIPKELRSALDEFKSSF